MLDIYLDRVSDLYSDVELYPPKRQEIINNTKSRDVRLERISAWKLLEYAVNESLDKSIYDISPYLLENGKWCSDSCYFSISHSCGIVAVAVSDSPVGIDVECYRKVDVDAFSRRILTESERKNLDDCEDKNEFMIEMWTKKECIYKMNGDAPFIPAKLECSNYPIKTRVEKIDGKEFYISVCSDKIDEIKFIFKVV